MFSLLSFIGLQLPMHWTSVESIPRCPPSSLEQRKQTLHAGSASLEEAEEIPIWRHCIWPGRVMRYARLWLVVLRSSFQRTQRTGACIWENSYLGIQFRACQQGPRATILSVTADRGTVSQLNDNMNGGVRFHGGKVGWIDPNPEDGLRWASLMDQEV